jgi:ABC-2 type transport system permease protein
VTPVGQRAHEVVGLCGAQGTVEMFTGSVQFPWRSLSGIAWFQVVCALNPLTYVSEGVRNIVLGQEIPSLPLWVDIPLIAVCCVVFGLIGVVGFVRRSRF